MRRAFTLMLASKMALLAVASGAADQGPTTTTRVRSSKQPRGQSTPLVAAGGAHNAAIVRQEADKGGGWRPPGIPWLRGWGRACGSALRRSSADLVAVDERQGHQRIVQSQVRCRGRGQEVRGPAAGLVRCEDLDAAGDSGFSCITAS
jgi:hypothetical protein